MAVPKKKTSKARTRRRRSENDKVASPSASWCLECGARKLPHCVCFECGTYRGRQVISVVAR